MARNPGAGQKKRRIARKTRKLTRKSALGSAGHITTPASGSAVPVASDNRQAKQKKKTKEKGRTRKKKYELECRPGEEIRFDTQSPPEGYVFVPKGDVYITRNCRVKTHESEKTVYIVYHRKSPTVAPQTGLFVPSSIYDYVLTLARSTQNARLAAVAQKDARDARHAGALLDREFPSMPEVDRQVVLRHAFLKGSGRVGRTTRLEEEQKVTLAVEAHVRHVHTEYDHLLDSEMDWVLARDKVRERVKMIKSQWAEGKDDPE